MINIGDGNFIDMRESQEFLQQATARGFKISRLTFHEHSDDQKKIERWQQVTRGDIECGDVANWQAIGEIKTIQDAMNWEHLLWQCHKMLWTGKFIAVFIRDYYLGRFTLVKTGVMNHSQISAIEHRFQAKIFKMKVPIFYCGDLDDTLNRIEYFLEHAAEFPKPVNTYNDHKSKFEEPLVMLCGIAGIGEAHARLFLGQSKTVGALGIDAMGMELDDFTKNYSKIKGIKTAFCEKVWKAFRKRLEQEGSDI